MLKACLTLLVAALMPVPGHALVVIGFEGINVTYPTTNYANILSFYDGGTSSQGTSGSNFGATFAANAVAVCLNDPGGNCSNAARGGLSSTSAHGALGISTVNSTYFDYPAGFTFAIGFSYAVAPGSFATISAYSGLGGTGALLAAPLILLPGSPGCPAYNATLCPLGPGGLSFSGTTLSIVFTGLPGDVVWDDLTLGANDPQSPQPVSEPGSLPMLVAALAMSAATMRRRRGADRQAAGRAVP